MNMACLNLPIQITTQESYAYPVHVGVYVCVKRNADNMELNATHISMVSCQKGPICHA